MDTTYTSEKSIKVFNDKSGDFIYIGPDSEGLGLVDIHWSDGVTPERPVTMEVTRALMVADAIYELYGGKKTLASSEDARKTDNGE